MTTFVFSIVVEGLDLDSDLQNAYLENLDFEVLAGRTAGNTYLDVEIECERPMLALDAVKKALDVASIMPVRVDQDLVTITEISERLDVSRETVRLWSAGERRNGFPTANSTVGKSTVWAWSDVYEWLIEHSIAIPEAYANRPLPLDVVHRANGSLARARQTSRSWGRSQATVVAGMPWSGRAPREARNYGPRMAEKSA